MGHEMVIFALQRLVLRQQRRKEKSSTGSTVECDVIPQVSTRMGDDPPKAKTALTMSSTNVH